ncbi:MAG: hypothetical protein KJ072_09885 [Verrucomicrobia bacterium]|nr:hypothetical protein [Verrucomicrobiota bacterium]
MKNESSIVRAGGGTRPPLSGWRGWVGLALCVWLAPAAWGAGGWASVTDPADMADTSGDIQSIAVHVQGEQLVLSMTVHGVAAPAVEQTPAGMNNRYYYHWLLDTDNNPATGRSNAEYEGSPTGLTSPIGYERVIMVGWRDGKPNGVEVYDPANEDVALVSNFSFQASGSTLTAVVPLAELGLVAGQTIAVSAFQEGSSNDWQVDWIESAVLSLEGLTVAGAVVNEPVADMVDSSGDIQGISVQAMGDFLYVSMTVQGIAAPSVTNTPAGMNNRYYYHWLLDTDNNPATGRSNAEYEGSPTGLANPIGYERVIMIGWRDGKPNGVEAYDPANEDVALVSNFPFRASGNTLTAVIPLADLGLVMGQTIAVSAFQEGASNDWQVDWLESDVVTLGGPSVPVAQVADPADMADSSGDIGAISAQVEGENLRLTMTVQGIAAPSTGNTPAGMNNRYYYHWLLDTDNNPATGRSNAEYEGSPTGLTSPIGYERVVMIGWRDGKPNGVEVYDPANEDVALVGNFNYQASGNTLTALIPLADLGLVVGQTIAVSAFQEGASNDWQVDWIESAVITLEPPSAGRMKIDGAFADWAEADAAGVVSSVDDPSDMADSSGDIKSIQATVEGGYLYVRMSVHGIALPSVAETPTGMNNRYYYHWLLDTDNNPATGRSNAEYEGSPTGLANPIGYERVIMIGWRDGNPNGLEVYDPANEDVALVSDFEYAADGDSVEARVRLSDLGLVVGQTIAISAFQEGASNDWQVDWIESTVMTLAEGGPGNWTLPALFAGNPYGFELEVTDEGDAVVDPATVGVRLDGQPVAATATKNGAVTLITGKHPALLEAGTTHTVAVALEAGGAAQSKDFIFIVKPYTVLPQATRFASIDTSNPGFVVNVTRVSSETLQAETLGGVHSNLVALAEQQLAGELLNTAGEQYYNEVELDWSKWVVTPEVLQGPINWYEMALEGDASLNFPNDELVPKLADVGFLAYEGVVVEILTYVELSEGFHQFGLYTEGGHKLSAGLDAQAPVLSMIDNSGPVEAVPSYYARSQFADVVAPDAGYYPLRLLWFQTRRGQEAGMMLEYFSVENRELHLLNHPEDPLSLKVYRAGVLVDPDFVMPTLEMRVEGNELVLEWTGTLQSAETLGGSWSTYADPSQSPLRLPAGTEASRFFRARSN